MYKTSQRNKEIEKSLLEHIAHVNKIRELGWVPKVGDPVRYKYIDEVSLANCVGRVSRICDSVDLEGFNHVEVLDFTGFVRTYSITNFNPLTQEEVAKIG